MISVIVPVYNVEKYLPHCIDSILNQTYTDLELILVNDASTDKSPAICEAYRQKDSRIVFVNKTQNEGVDKARFSGLEVCKGGYVAFVDSDDWLDNEDVLSVMHRKAEETQADYVEIGMQRVMDRHKWIKKAGVSPVVGGK